MSGWFIYFIIMAGKFAEFLDEAVAISLSFCGACLFGVAVLYILWICDRREDLHMAASTIFKVIKKYIWIPLLLVFLNLLMPNLKEIAAIYLIPKVVNNESVQDIPIKSLELLEVKLDEWIADVKEDK